MPDMRVNGHGLMDLPSRKAIGGHMNPTTVVVDKTVLLSILAKQAAVNGMIRPVPSRGLSIARWCDSVWIIDNLLFADAQNFS